MGACWSTPTDVSELEAFPYRHVLITGASSGIGTALAVQLSTVPSITLTLIARHPERLQTVAAACRDQGATVLAMIADIGDQTAMEYAIHQAHKVASLDLVIANAGVVAQPEHQDQLPDMMRQAAHTNIIGTLNTIVPALKLLKAHAAAGCAAAVAVMSSVSAVSADTVRFTGQLQMGMLPYAWCKQSLLMLGLGLEGELAGTGVKVFTICPGVVLTDLATNWTQFFMGTSSTPDSNANTGGPNFSNPAAPKAAKTGHHGDTGKTGNESTVLVSVNADGDLSLSRLEASEDLTAHVPSGQVTSGAAASPADNTEQKTGPGSAAYSNICLRLVAANAPKRCASGGPNLSASTLLALTKPTSMVKSIGSSSSTASKVAEATPEPAAKASAKASAEEWLKMRFGAITPDEAAAAILKGLALGQGGIIAFPAQAVWGMRLMEKLPNKLLARAIRKGMAKYDAANQFQSGCFLEAGFFGSLRRLSVTCRSMQ